MNRSETAAGIFAGSVARKPVPKSDAHRPARSGFESRGTSRRSPGKAGLASEAGLSREAVLSREAGLTLVELIITVAILSILATAALPMVAIQVKRAKERQLRADLWEMRRAIDAYKDVADLGGIQTKADSNNYPPDLQTLVDGVDVKDKKMRFLRAVPIDPMTGNSDWGLRSNQDEPDSTSFGGQNVYDVYSKSEASGLDGTKYKTW